MSLFQYEWLLRLVCSVTVGTLIGYERHVRSKDAGIRTHAIVALASCLMMLISQYAFPDAGKFDASRVAAGVVSGIGFLGAGLIFAHDGSIYGLTVCPWHGLRLADVHRGKSLPEDLQLQSAVFTDQCRLQDGSRRNDIRYQRGFAEAWL